eukprot:scaffold66881_cov63-Phaeocystis_antarctica.AAC.2
MAVLVVIGPVVVAVINFELARVMPRVGSLPHLSRRRRPATAVVGHVAPRRQTADALAHM